MMWLLAEPQWVKLRLLHFTPAIRSCRLQSRKFVSGFQMSMTHDR